MTNDIRSRLQCTELTYSTLQLCLLIINQVGNLKLGVKIHVFHIEVEYYNNNKPTPKARL